MKKDYSPAWKASSQPRKQRKYRAHAPLHTRQHFLHSHLSKELRAKHKVRSVLVRVGDKVKVQRGQHAGATGKVERVLLRRERVFVTGVDVQKRDGSKAFYPLNASNLLIIELNLDDKRRREKLT